MRDYQQGKIYKIINDDIPNKTYYGSTTRQLSTRLAEHKYAHKQNKSGSVMELFNSGKAEIFLVKNCPCNSKEELKKIEREVIEKNECVNKSLPLQTQKEWEKKNSEYISFKKKLYYQQKKSN